MGKNSDESLLKIVEIFDNILKMFKENGPCCICYRSNLVDS